MVAGITQDHGWLIAAWLAGALCYAELCAAHPHAGGEYHFLSRAWGKRLAFLYAWSKAMVINTGSIALLAYVFGAFQADGFEAMVEFTAPVFWTFLFMVGLAVFRLRRRHPGIAPTRPSRA